MDNKEYLEAKRIVRAHHRKIAAERHNALPLWEIASKHLRDATIISAKLRDPDLTTRLPSSKAIEAFRNAGIKAFNEAMSIVERLSDEDKELLWTKNERNRNVTCFEELIPRGEYLRSKLIDTRIKTRYNSECSICLEAIETSDVGVLKCLHTFHIDCVNEWLKKNDTCPLCRIIA